MYVQVFIFISLLSVLMKSTNSTSRY